MIFPMPSMKLLRTLLLCSLLFGQHSCKTGDENTASATPSHLTRADAEVLECALSHLEHQNLRLGNDQEVLVLSNRTLGYCPFAESNSIFESIELDSTSGVLELAHALDQRNRTSVCLSGLSASPFRLARIDSMPIGEGYMASGVFRDTGLSVGLWLPGFLPTLDRALVLMLIGPHRHGILAAFVLDRNPDAVWNITDYGLAYMK